jgi:hypothetical protein
MSLASTEPAILKVRNIHLDNEAHRSTTTPRPTGGGLIVIRYFGTFVGYLGTNNMPCVGCLLDSDARGFAARLGDKVYHSPCLLAWRRSGHRFVQINNTGNSNTSFKLTDRLPQQVSREAKSLPRSAGHPLRLDGRGGGITPSPSPAK